MQESGKARKQKSRKARSHKGKKAGRKADRMQQGRNVGIYKSRYARRQKKTEGH